MKSILFALIAFITPALASPSPEAIRQAIHELDKASEKNLANSKEIKAAKKENSLLIAAAKEAHKEAEKLQIDKEKAQAKEKETKGKLDKTLSRVNKGMWYIVIIGLALGAFVGLQSTRLLPRALRVYTWQIPLALSLSFALFLAIGWQAFFRI